MKILAGICVLLFASDFLTHRHGHFGIDNVPGFYGILGAVSVILILFLEKLFSALRVKKGYYNE